MLQNATKTVAGTAAAWMLAAMATTGQTPPPGITRTAVLENETVLVARLALAPGAREDVHTHPFSAVVVQLGEGTIDMQLGRARTAGPRGRGFVEFVASELPHAAANVGSNTVEVVTVAVKPGRAPAPATPPAPPAPPPAGITRADALDTDELRVTRLTFAASAQEPVHEHPVDLVVVMLTPGRLSLRLGGDTTTRAYAAGEVVFVPRGTPHAVANAGDAPVDLLAVAVK